MTRILTTLHLSTIQKQVLAKVKAAANPKMAWEEIIKVSNEFDRNFATARDVLGNLGVLEVGDGELTITPKGEQAMVSANITDETGQLTDEGQQLASANTQGNQQQQTNNTNMGGLDSMGGDMSEFPTESISLFREIHQRLNEEIAMNAIRNKNKP